MTGAELTSECPDVTRDQTRPHQGKVGGGGGESHCGCDLCVEISADTAGPGQPMQTHMASLIVSAESLYSLFTRSLNDSSCWN